MTATSPSSARSRRDVDAVLVGTGTARSKNYGRMIKDPDARARRVAQDLPAEPIACMLTRRGDVRVEIPLFAEPEARVVIFAGTNIDLRDAQAHVEVVRLAPGETLATALADLRRQLDVRALLCEGGPGVLSALLRKSGSLTSCSSTAGAAADRRRRRAGTDHRP